MTLASDDALAAKAGEGNSEALGRLLAEAERDGRSLAAASLAAAGLTPPTIEAAMAAQAAGVAVDGRPVGAWKVAIRPEGLAVAAPMLALWETPAAGIAAVGAPYMQAIEVEIAIRLGADLPARAGTPYRREDIVASIASVHLGLEIVTSRLQEGNKSPFFIFLADKLANDGYLLGSQIDPAILDGVEKAGMPPLVVRRDGETIFSAPARHPNGDPLAPVVAYANAQTDRLGGLRKGQVVTTGSLCGIVPATGPCRLEIDWIAPLVVDIGR